MSKTKPKTKPKTKQPIVLLALAVILIAVFCGNAAAQQHLTGTLPDGATYVIDLPPLWTSYAPLTEVPACPRKMKIAPITA